MRVPPHLRHRSVAYALFGAVLALGAPLGLFIMRRILAQEVSLRGAFLEIKGDLPTYAYVTVSTAIVLVVLGLVLGRSSDRLNATATTDALTEIANRRLFGDRLALEVERAARYGSPLSLMLVDVDHLKRINDDHGHEGGDAALRHVARGLSTSCRATDLVARWGGDEFTVLLPGVTAAAGAQLAERIRTTLRQAQQGLDAATVSIGIADLAGVEEGTADALLHAADSALYRAKTGGRDRAFIHASPVRRIGGATRVAVPGESGSGDPCGT